MIDNLTVYEFFEDADYYGICETAANTAAKVVTIPDFTLENGVSVMVKFKNGNTANSPTLNVSDTGVKPIYIDPSVGTSVSWDAWKVLPFVYDGTNWQLVCDPGIAVTQIPTDDTNNNYEVLFSKSPDNLEHMEEVRKSQYLNYNPNQRTLFVNDENEHIDEVITDICNTENFTGITTYGTRWYQSSFKFEVRDEINPSQRRAIVVYNNPISSGVKHIRYRIESATKGTGPQPSDSNICIGVKSTFDTTTEVTSTDNDWITKEIHSTPTSNATFEGELAIDIDSNFYLYIIGNNWNFTVTQIDLVSYNSILNRSYLTDNELGVIKTSNNVTTSLKVKDNDIILSGTGNTWDGTNTSLKNAFSQRCKTVVDTFSTSTGEISEYITSATLSAAGITNLSQWTIVGLMYNDPGYNDANHWDTPRVVNGSMNLTAMLDYENNRIKIDYLGANGSRTFRVTLVKTTL